MKNIILLSALIGSSMLGGFACTKKAADRTPNDAPMPPPSAVPDATTPTDQTIPPTTNEMPGQPDSTNSVPGDTANPMGQDNLPSDTTPAPGN